MSVSKAFSSVAEAVAHAAGRPLTFAVCVAVVIVWAVSGPFFHFSDTWQLVINTGTTIVTFLMVFLIQNTQNRDGAAIQAKLDEIIRASAAQNTYIGIEHLTEENSRSCANAVKPEPRPKGSERLRTRGTKPRRRCTSKQFKQLITPLDQIEVSDRASLNSRAHRTGASTGSHAWRRPTLSVIGIHQGRSFLTAQTRNDHLITDVDGTDAVTGFLYADIRHHRGSSAQSCQGNSGARATSSAMNATESR